MGKYADAAGKLLALMQETKFEKCDKCGHKTDDRACLRIEAIGTTLGDRLSDAIRGVDLYGDYDHNFAKQALEAIVNEDPEDEDGLTESREAMHEEVYTWPLLTFLAENPERAEGHLSEYGTLAGLAAFAYREAQEEIHNEISELVKEIAEEDAEVCDECRSNGPQADCGCKK